jgi:hypothetical protein
LGLRVFGKHGGHSHINRGSANGRNLIKELYVTALLGRHEAKSTVINNAITKEEIH